MAENEDITTKAMSSTGDKEEEEYVEEYKIDITTQKGSSIKAESSSYNKLDGLIEKAFTTYKRLTKEESGDVEEKQQYQ
jgi:hypothetical protein